MRQSLATTYTTRYSILISLLINKYILLSVILSTERAQGRKGKWTVRPFSRNPESNPSRKEKRAHLQSSVFKLSKDLIDSIHEEGIVAYTS